MATEQKINIGKMMEDEAQRSVERAFSPLFVFRSPRKDEDKNKEVTDVLVPWDDLALVIQVKAQALSPEDPRITGAEPSTKASSDPLEWAQSNLEKAGRQVKGAVRTIRAGRMTEVENPLRGRVSFDEKQIRWLYGLVVLEHQSAPYDPFQLVPELEKTTVPLHVLSYCDFANLAILLDTPADLITYLETRSDVLLPTLKPKVHEEQQVFRYYVENLEDLQAFRAEKRGDDFSKDDAKPYAENLRRLWNDDLPEAGLGAVVDHIIERAHEHDPSLGPIQTEHEYEPADTVLIATELSKIPRVRRIALGQSFWRTIWRADEEKAQRIHRSYSKGRDECLLFLASPRPITERDQWRKDLEMLTWMLKHHHQAKTAMGIATQAGENAGRSYDFVYLEGDPIENEEASLAAKEFFGDGGSLMSDRLSP